MTPEEFTSLVRPVTLSHKNFNKVFCIGYNKTGTTTLETIFNLYGYRVPNQHEQEIRLTRSCFACDYTAMQQFVAQYDAFQDMPFSQGEVYIAADALFPNSRFILTERDSEHWYRSMTEFHKQVFGIKNLTNLTERDLSEKFKYLYPNYIRDTKKWMLTEHNGAEEVTRWDKLYDKDFYTQEYQRHNQGVKKYFQNSPEKLLVIDVTQEANTQKILDFLNIPKEYAIDMPHMNRTSVNAA